MKKTYEIHSEDTQEHTTATKTNKTEKHDTTLKTELAPHSKNTNDAPHPNTDDAPHSLNTEHAPHTATATPNTYTTTNENTDTITEPTVKNKKEEFTKFIKGNSQFSTKKNRQVAETRHSGVENTNQTKLEETIFFDKILDQARPPGIFTRSTEKLTSLYRSKHLKNLTSLRTHFQNLAIFNNNNLCTHDGQNVPKIQALL